MKSVKSAKGAKARIRDMKFLEGTEEVFVNVEGYVYYSHTTALNHSKGDKIFTVKIK
jgi:hypothetical protein